MQTGKSKANPIQAWTGPYGSRKLKLTGLIENRHMNVASLSRLRTGRLYHPREIPGHSFLLETESTPGP
jgi:hypothetical protein